MSVVRGGKRRGIRLGSGIKGPAKVLMKLFVEQAGFHKGILKLGDNRLSRTLLNFSCQQDSSSGVEHCIVRTSYDSSVKAPCQQMLHFARGFVCSAKILFDIRFHSAIPFVLAAAPPRAGLAEVRTLKYHCLYHKSPRPKLKRKDYIKQRTSSPPAADKQEGQDDADERGKQEEEGGHTIEPAPINARGYLADTLYVVGRRHRIYDAWGPVSVQFKTFEARSELIGGLSGPVEGFKGFFVFGNGQLAEGGVVLGEPAADVDVAVDVATLTC